ncbi:cold shock domain-containing protein [Psychrobacter sp. FME13]|uniref:ribonuclease domain-containing protein n=1 Tax=unclassified Psychrobacter TaxID=196806 RepID=UPI0017883A19|nr:ribonuclease domain-containing protein [Psychrobacter sp. FME13]MBE0443069.1 cold shock domain-containing protein [Psychrobacter sp. FME13]
MQSGRIKHWNKDKGYGFIDVDNQSEDVFFHISTVRLSQPIGEGQTVYFNSERNEKNQLRATEVTSTKLSLQDSPQDSVENSNETSLPKHHSNNNNTSTQNTHNNRNTRQHNSNRNKKSPLSTLFSLIAIIAVAFYFFDDIKSTAFSDSAAPTAISQISSENSNQAPASSVTGDAQIDKIIMLIKQGGPFPYPNKDGTSFYNREGRLPAQSQGYYREYTVPTPGVSHRGARRIVTGGNPPTVYYLTVDHYDSFKKLDVK